MTSFETLDEIYLMIISGLAPIRRIPYLENLAPKLPKYPKPVVNVSQDQEEHDSNSTVSYGFHRSDTQFGMTDISGEFNSEFITESQNSSFSYDDDSKLNGSIQKGHGPSEYDDVPTLELNLNKRKLGNSGHKKS